MFDRYKSGPARTLFTHNCSDCDVEMTSEEWRNSQNNMYYSCFGIHLCKDCIKKREDKVSNSGSENNYEKGKYPSVDSMIDLLIDRAYISGDKEE